MKVTIEPETETEKAETQGATYAGLKSVAVIGLAYEGEVLRRPYRFSYGDLEDLIGELLPVAFNMYSEIQRAKS